MGAAKGAQPQHGRRAALRGRLVPTRGVRATLCVALLSYGLAMAERPPPRDGEAVYEARCAPCHGADGKTDTSVGRVFKVAPLVDDPRLARMTPAEIAQLVIADPKHRSVADLDDADVKAAAVFVKKLAGGR